MRKKLIQQPPIQVQIESLTHEGRGKTIINGKVTFVSNALPQEQVLVQITKAHSRYQEGRALEIIKPAPERVTPACNHFNVCGGCTMQHLAMEQQIHYKQQALLEQLQHFGQVTPKTILAPLTAQSLGYRRKARLGVRYVEKKASVLVGFREAASNYLADITSCQVLHPSIGLRITSLRTLIASLDDFRHIPQIEVAIGDQTQALVFRHLQPLSENDLEKLQQYGATENLHIYLQPNSPQALVKLWPQDNHYRLSYFLPQHQLEMQFHPLDFTQINGELNPKMIDLALKLLAPQPQEKILDLFCGLGNFTLPIARFCAQVTGIEGSQEMVERAKENARLNHLINTEFYAENLMATTIQADWAKQDYDKILLDPPRSGAAEILPLLARFNPSHIVYVSCNPATLARDAGILVNQFGYSLSHLGVMNMFPHTSHIEAIALFEKPR